MTSVHQLRDVTDDTFEQEVLQSSLPVLVDFWAAWCTPCKTLEPTLESIAKEFAGKAVIARLNVDDNPRMVGRYDIKGIPTLILYKAGEQKAIFVGVRSMDEIAKMIERHLPSWLE